LAGCETVEIPVVYTLAPTLASSDSTLTAQAQIFGGQTAEAQSALTQNAASPTLPETPTLTPVNTATAIFVETPQASATLLPTATPVPPTETLLLPPTWTPMPPTLTSPPVLPTRTPIPAPSLTLRLTPANLIANPSFEEGWTLSPLHQQHVPNGWQLYSPETGQTLPFPTKLQQENTIPALADDAAESEHFLAKYLPDDEQLGQPRALILDGKAVLRTRGSWRASAVVLRQTLSAPAGATVRVTGYILAESLDPGPKEADDLVAALRLYGAAGLVEDKRTLAGMQTHSDVPNNSRHWNRFEVVAPAPASGQLQLEIVLQQNWGLASDTFFSDNFSAAVRP
jgi:hypothetical protein